MKEKKQKWRALASAPGGYDARLFALLREHVRQNHEILVKWSQAGDHAVDLEHGDNLNVPLLLLGVARCRGHGGGLGTAGCTDERSGGGLVRVSHYSDLHRVRPPDQQCVIVL